MLHSIKRATVGIMAAQNEPISDEFENHRAALAKIQTAFGIELGNIDSSHANSNKFISHYGSFYKDMVYLYPTENKTSRSFHIVSDSVQNSLRSRAVSLSEPERICTKWS